MFENCDNTHLIHQSKHLLVDHFSRHRECFPQFFLWNLCTHKCTVHSGIMSTPYWYRRKGNYDTVFIYQQIPNFTNCEHLVTFEKCEHHMSHFISRSVARSTISFIIVNVFPLLLMESVYPQTYCAFRHNIYTIHIL